MIKIGFKHFNIVVGSKTKTTTSKNNKNNITHQNIVNRVYTHYFNNVLMSQYYYNISYMLLMYCKNVQYQYSTIQAC